MELKIQGQSRFSALNFRRGITSFFFMVFLSGSVFNGFAEKGQLPSEISSPVLIPTITGPATVCNGAGGYIYTTEAGMSNYSWSVSSAGSIISGAGTNSVSITWATPGAGVVTVNYTSATSPGSLDVTVLSSVTPSVTIVAGANPSCSGSIVTYTATAINGGPSPVFQWMVNGIPVGVNNAVFSYTPSNGDIVLCQMTSNAPCSSPPQVTSSPITMIVNTAQMAGVTVSVSSNPVCQGTPVNFTATPTLGGNAPVYQWKVNGINSGTIAPVFTMVPANGDVVICEMTSNAQCVTGNPASSNPVSMTVSPALPVTVSVTPSANPVCQGNQVTLTANATNGGSTPQYLWKVNGIQTGSNSTYLTYLPVNGDVVTCQLTSNSSCATGNPAISGPVAMMVNTIVPVEVTIQSSSNPVCQGSAVTLIATAVNGGNSPQFQWTLNGFPVGSNASSYTCIPANGDAIHCKLFSSIACPSVFPAVSNTIMMTVNPNVPVNVSVTASSNPVCISSPVTFTAVPFNGGSAPVFEWRVNGLPAGVNNPVFTYIPNHGDHVNCQMTSNAGCVPPLPVVSNTVMMTVSPQLPVSVSIAASANPVCQNVQVVYTATAVNGGTNPVYQWQINGINTGGNSAVFAHIPVDGDQISCMLTSNAACTSGNPAISNIVSIGVIPSIGVPVAISITASANPSCAGQPVTFTASSVNGGSAPVFVWTVNGLTLGTNSTEFSYIPSSGDFIRCMVTSNLTCATNNPAMSNEIVMTVNPILPVSVSIISSANPSCLGSNVTYTANAVNAGSAPLYQWRVNGVNSGTNQNTFVYSPVNGTVITCEVTSDMGCVTGNPAISNAITMTVFPVLPVTVSISTPTNPACKGSQVTFHATITNGGTSPAYQWKLNGVTTGANSAILMFTPANGDIITCRLTSNALCYSGNKVVFSNPITMSVSAELAPSVSISASANPFCEGSQVSYTATPMNGGATPVYQWQVNCVTVGTNSPNYSFVPEEGDFVVCRMTSNLSCAVMNPCKSNAITMVPDTNTPAGIHIVVSENPVCQGATSTFTASVTNGGTSPLFQWKVNGLNVGSNSPVMTYSPANNDVVNCQLISNAFCVSGNPVLSNSVTMLVSSALAAEVAITTPTNPFCTGTAVNFTAVGTHGGSAPVYQWKINGIANGVNSNSFVFSPSNGDVVTCSLTSNASCISGPNPVISNALVMQQATQIPATVLISTTGNPACSGAASSFTAIHSGGGNNPVFEWQVNGIQAGSGEEHFTYFPMANDVVSCILHSDLVCANPTSAISNSLVMNVNPRLPVAVTISASANPCCFGSMVTFNAAVTNSGSSPAYQWFVNCIPVGTNSAEYTYAPVNGDVVVCRVLSSETCSSGNPAVSNNINMIVLPVQPVGVMVVPSFNPFCIGSPITFTATASNGGNSPHYQWLVNNIMVGPDDSLFTYNPADHDTVECIVTSNSVCVSGNPAISPEVVMTGISALPVTISVVASNNPICQGTMVTFTATGTNGGNTPDYQWKVNGNNVGQNRHTYQYTPGIGDVVTCQFTTSLSCASPNPAISAPLNMTVYPQTPVSIVIAATENPVCQGTPVTFTATVNNGGTSPVYRWRVNGTIVSTTSTLTYVPVNGDDVYCRYTSNVICHGGTSPANSNHIIMSVNPTTPASLTIAPSANPVCENSTVVFTTTPSNGGTAPIYLWMVNGVVSGSTDSTFSYSPVNGDQVSCEMISNSMCTAFLNAVSNTVTLTVSPIQPVSVTVVPNVNPVCVNSLVTYTATAVNGGFSPQYQWQVNGNIAGTNSPVFNYVPVNNDLVTCMLTSGVACSSGNPAMADPVIMTVSTSLPVSISVTPSENPTCQGTTIDFTAWSVNGGISPVYQWMVNGINVGTNSPAYTYSPSQGDYVNCQVTSDFYCATGNPANSEPLYLQVDPNLPTAVSIVSSANPVCAGSPVVYTALPINGGSIPDFQWQVNGVDSGTNQDTFTYLPLNGDTVTCRMHSTLPCTANNPSQSNAIVMNVVEPVPINVSVTVSQNPTCQGSQVTFSAIPENGGYNPVYQWKVNGQDAGNGLATYSYTPVDGDVVVCELTSNATCTSSSTVQSAPVTMIVSTDLPVTASIQASANPVCTGQSVVYTATVENGGQAPQFQWMVNGINVGTNDAAFTFTPSNGDTVACLITSDFSCATGNPAISNLLIMSVTSAIPPGIGIVASANPVCFGNPVTYTASVINAGLNPYFTWSVNGTISGTNQDTFTYIPLNGDAITCQVTSSDPCNSASPVQSNQVLMVVSTDLPVSVMITGSASQVCAGTQVSYTATWENGGANPVFQWLVNGIPVGNNSEIFSYFPVNGDLVKCIIISGLSCATGNPATSNTLVMVVNQPQMVSVSITPNPSGAVCAGTPVVLSANPVNGGTSPVFQWYKNGSIVGLNQPTYSFTPLNNDQVFVVLSSNQQCSTGSPASSDTLTFAVTDPVSVGVSIAASQNNVCQGTSITFTATAVNGGSPTWQWFVNGVPAGINQSTFSYVPGNNDQVYVEITSSLACVIASAATSNVIIMVVNPMVPVGVNIYADQNPVCQGSQVTFTATPSNGGVPVYQWYLNGLATGFNQPTFTCAPNNGDLVYVEMTSSLTCVTNTTAVSNTIAMTVNGQVIPTVNIAVSQNPVCQGTGVTFTATPENGGNPTFQWYKNGIPVGSNSPQYDFIPVNGDQVYVDMTSSLTCVTSQVVSSNAVVMMVDDPVVTWVTVSENQNNVCAGTLVTFTAEPVNGGTPYFQWFKNGTAVGTNSYQYSCVPLDGDQVYVEMTSDIPCASPVTAVSDSIGMVVHPLLSVKVTIDSDTNNICQGTPVTFTASPENGGTPVYQWYKNGLMVGSDLPVYTCIPDNGDKIVVEMTTSLTCVNAASVLSDTITMTVDIPLKVSVTITADLNEVCAGTPVTFTALPENGGEPVFHWFKNGIAVGSNGPLYVCTPAFGDRIYAEMISSILCVDSLVVTSNQISPLVHEFPGQASTVSGPASVCAGSQMVVFSVPSVDGATSYHWELPQGAEVISGANTNTITLNFPNVADTGFVSVAGMNACGSGGSSPAAQVIIFAIPEPPVATRQVNSILSSALTGNEWYFEGSLIPDSTGRTLSPSVPGWYWCSSTVNGCTSDTSNHVYFDGLFPGPITSEPGFWVYPVPNDGRFTVAISLPAQDTFSITVYNSLGVQLYVIPDFVVENRFKQVIDLRARMPKGLLTVVFKCNDYRVIKKALIYNR